jgi:hypothetical protein
MPFASFFGFLQSNYNLESWLNWYGQAKVLTIAARLEPKKSRATAKAGKSFIMQNEKSIRLRAEFSLLTPSQRAEFASLRLFFSDAVCVPANHNLAGASTNGGGRGGKTTRRKIASSFDIFKSVSV